MKVKIQKTTVLFPTLDLSDRKLRGKKIKAMILALSMLNKICIECVEVPLNREKNSNQMMVISGSTHRVTIKRDDRLLGKSSIFLL